MKKSVFLGIPICLLLLFLSSCKFINSVYLCNEIFIENCTGEKIAVSFQEDPETVTSKHYGASSFSKTIKDGKKVNTKAVVNDYYKIMVNGNVIYSKGSVEGNEYPENGYYLISGTNIVLKIYKNDDGYYFKETSDLYVVY